MTAPSHTTHPNLTPLNTSLTPPPTYFSLPLHDMGTYYQIGAIFPDKRRAAAELSQDGKGPFTQADETLITGMDNEWEAMIEVLLGSNNPEAMELGSVLMEKTMMHALGVRNRISASAQMDSPILLESSPPTPEGSPLSAVARSESSIVGSALSESGSWDLTTASSSGSVPPSPAESLPSITLSTYHTPALSTVGSSAPSMATATLWYTPSTSTGSSPVSLRLSQSDPFRSLPMSRMNSDRSLSTLPCEAHSTLAIITVQDMERILRLSHLFTGNTPASLSMFGDSRLWRERSRLSLNESADPTLFAFRPVHERMFRHVRSLNRPSASSNAS